MKVKRRVKMLAVGTVLGVMLWMILLPLFTGDTAHAQIVSYPINYNGQATAGWQSAYSRHATLDLPLTAEAITGKSISKVELMLDGNPIETYTDMTGQANWSKTLTSYVGTAIEVASSENSTTKGYYAWYRAPEDTKWQADLILPDGSSEHRTVDGINELDSYGLPAAPAAVEDRLTLGGSRTTGFIISDVNPPGGLTKGQEWDFNLVDLNPSFVKIETKWGEWIDGPFGTKGQPDFSVLPYSSNWKETFVGDLQNFRIRYKEDFSFEPPGGVYYSADGDKVNVYFAAFETSFVSHTYRYPNEIRVTYVDNPGASVLPTPTPTAAPTTDDLEVVSLTFSPATFTPRDEVTFTWVFRNNGDKPVSNFYYNYGGVEGLFTGTLKPGETHTGTVNWNIPSTRTVTVTIDSRNLIPELNETNNEKSVTVTPEGLGDNKPPEGRLRWFLHGSEQEVTSVTEGTWVDLRYVDVKDPEGDPVGYKMNFADINTVWLRNYMVGRWTEGDGYDAFSGINTTGGLGYHVVKGYLKDSYGAISDPLTAGLSVIPPNPVAVITGQTSVKEARPLTQPFSAANSYSPLGRSIDHSRDEWTNKQEIYYTPGTETITLKVWDSVGLPSLNTATHTLTVLPDEPPVALGKAPTKAIRGAAITIKDASYSRDGDPLKQTEISEQYDSNNDGGYDGEILAPLSFDAEGKLIRTFDRVGTYRYTIRSIEDTVLNKESTSYFYIEVVNDAPWVSFEMSSEVKEPQIIPTVPVSLDPDNWSATSTAEDTVKKNWTLESDGSISSYWYTAYQVKSGYDSSTSGNPATLNMRTSDPYQTQLIDVGPSGDDETSYVSAYVDGLGIISNYTNYCESCGNQYSYDLNIKDTAGVWKRFLNSGRVKDISLLNDEVEVEGYSGFTYIKGVYKLSSLFTSNPILLRPNSTVNHVVPERVGGLNFSFVPPAISDYTEVSGGWTRIGTTGVDAKGNKGEFSGSSYLRKIDKNNNVLWSVSNDHWYGRYRYEYTPYSLFYNLDETKMFTVGEYTVYDSEDDRYSRQQRIVVYDSSSGNVTASLDISNFTLGYSGAITNFIFGGKLHVISSDGLRVYDSNLTVVKYDSRITVGGKFMGDGFLQLSSTSLYDLRTYDYVPLPSETYKAPMQIYEDLYKSIYGKGTAFIKAYPYDRPLTSHSQLINPSLPSMSSFNINFKYKYQEDNYLSMNHSGMAFKIQDRRNMYRLEFNNSKVSLVKIVEGGRTVLHTQDYMFDKGTYYSFRIRSNENKHTIYVNGVPLFDVTDNTFQAGTFGPSTDFFNVSFKDLTYQDLSAASGSSLTRDTVIVDQQIQYALTFEDLENDPHPIDLTWWKFEQLEPWKFLDAGDGKSGWSVMNGRTDHGNLPSLDKVGIWKVTHWLKDDPHPDYPYPSEVFGNHRGESNQYSRNIIVHRRPVAQFTLGLNGDGTISWNDTSYDPDRWLSDWNYSTESPVYASNRGIYSRKYKYITPSGLELEGRLTRPSESGVYTVSEAVMDEYGAWSEWYDQQITATIILPPNKIPVVDFDSPRYVYRDDLVQLINKSVDPDGDALSYNWSIMKPPYTGWLSNAEHPSFRIVDRGLGKDAVSPNWFITLEATDSKGETGSKTKPLMVLNHIPTTAIHGPADVLIRQTHTYTSGGDDQDSEDHGQLSYYWKVTAPDGAEADYSGSSAISLTFSQGGTYKLEHWVIDPVGDSSNVAQLLVDVDDNKPPVPGFAVTPSPAYRGETVSVTSTASDPDGIIAKHDYWITGPDGVEQHWTATPDWSRTYGTLGSYTIRQRVEDNKGAAAEASQVLQVVNRLPTVELNTPSGPDAEHPSVNIPPFRAEWSYADGDGDPQQSWHFRIYESGTDALKIEGAGNNAANGFHVAPGVLVGGVTYYAVVSVSDGFDTTTSQPKYFMLNRPPVADFTWSPNPVYEGDTVTLISLSTDPDGDVLSESWEITAPDGSSLAYDAAHPPRWTQVGDYQVKLTVTDPFGASSSKTKDIPVLPLSIEGHVHHTPQWNINRQKSNLDKGDDPESPWSANQFLAGEKFMLTATTTTIQSGSSVQPTDVWVTLADTEDWDHLSFTTGARDTWEGELYKPEFYHLPQGTVTFVFEVLYNNGTRKQDLVEVEIRAEQTDDYWQLIRDK